MSRVVRFRDNGRECWARVDLTNGDPIWISVAQSSVVIKKSRMGLLGATLYKEESLMHSSVVATNLEFMIDTNETNSGFSIALRPFVKAALKANSAAELCSVLRQAANNPAQVGGNERPPLNDGSVYGMVRYIQNEDLLVVHHPHTHVDGKRILVRYFVPKPNVQKGISPLTDEMFDIKIGDWISFTDVGSKIIDGTEYHRGEFECKVSGEFNERLAESFGDGTTGRDLEKVQVTLYVDVLTETLERNGADKDFIMSCIFGFIDDYSKHQFGVDMDEVRAHINQS